MLDAIEAYGSRKMSDSQIEANNEMADKMTEYTIAQGHKADYTDDYNKLSSMESSDDNQPNVSEEGDMIDEPADQTEAIETELNNEDSDSGLKATLAAHSISEETTENTDQSGSSLKDTLAQASEAEANGDTEDVPPPPPPNDGGMDDNNRSAQRDAVVNAWLAQQRAKER